ncbi:chalcone-flavanone isomerase-domain-containing protein [Cytidiella melzeri]|nr:chalcone-flavanone isomerase-domain-containing protein [Cytidiella melzeri]
MLSPNQPFVCRALSAATIRFFSSAATRRGCSVHAGYSHTVRAYSPWIWGSALAISAVLMGQSTIKLDSDLPYESLPPEETVDPASSISFPNTLQISSKTPFPEMTLVGVGVRTVSFLGIQVYSVGFYANLQNPNLNIPGSASPQEKVEYLVQNSACVLRIVPTRSTSFSHLRDGFMRALQARMVLLRQRGALSKDEELTLQSPLHKFKTMFPNTPLAKHTPLDILLAPPKPRLPRSLIIRDLGSVQHDWLAVQFFMAYFEGDGISPAMKKSVFKRLESLGQ